MSDNLRNIFCISIAILFFLFLFLYSLNAYKEGFVTDAYNKVFKPTLPIDFAQTNLVQYNGQWNNSQSISSQFTRDPNPNIVATNDNCNWQSYIERYVELKAMGIDTKEKVWDHWINTGMKNKLWMDVKYAHTVINSTTKDPVMWKDLPFNTNKIETKMNDFSISFWLYINKVSDSWQPIFKITDPKNPSGRLGVWLWKDNSSLFIQQQSSPFPLNSVGWETEIKKFSIPIKRATFCMIVFSGNRVSIFMNGKKVGDSRVPLDSIVNTTGSLEIGQAITRYRYVMKDFNMYTTSLGDDVAATVYLNQNYNPTSDKKQTTKVRYIKIQQQNQYLHIQEIEVYNEKGENIAKNSTPSGSSTGWGASPGLVTDGKVGQGWPNSNHTLNSGTQYLELNLNANVDVKRIKIYNRPDCCQDRLKGAILLLYDENRNPVADTFTLNEAREQTFEINTSSYSISDDAYIFFKGSTENFTNMTTTTMDGGSFLNSWKNFRRTETFTTPGSIALPNQIQLDGGGTFDFYKYKPTRLNDPSFKKNLEFFQLDPNIFSIDTPKKLYYYSFDSKYNEYINIPKNILFKEKGCTFALWFSYDQTSRNWPRLFDFGKGPGQDNIIFAILNQKLQFYVWNGQTSQQHEANIYGGSGSNWYHVAWTMDPIGNNWTIYINGNLDKSVSNKLTPKTYEEIPQSGTVTLTGYIEKIVNVTEGFYVPSSQRRRTTPAYITIGAAATKYIMNKRAKKKSRRQQREQQRREPQQQQQQQRLQQLQREQQLRQQREQQLRQQSQRQRQQSQHQQRLRQLKLIFQNRRKQRQQQHQQQQRPQPDYSNRGLAQTVRALPVPKTQKIRSPVTEVMTIASGNSLIINDMANTKMKYDTKNVTVAKNTKVTLFSETNLLGTSISFQDPSQIGNVYEFPFKSMKIEKIKSTEYVVRQNQYIGRSNWNHDEFLNGFIGDFRIYDEVLSGPQIKEIYKNPIDPYNR